jgi:predicted CXXCH cytochrome family protein
MLWYCGTDATADDKFAGAATEWRNMQDSVKYVGLQTCQSCHGSIAHSFHETGMGKSFANATLQKTSAKFDNHALVYDKDNDFYYQPFFKDSIFYIKEYRMEGSDTVHSRTERVAYIIGSGHHTNSHLINQNGYVYQAPITFYTQEGKWDLAPGFEHGANTRFSRIITNECLTCHNHYPTPVAGAENKFEAMPQGIECERCHGPGQLHVKEKLAGKLIDTSKQADYSIVNPRRLPKDLQLDLCQRCHLQGVAVLNDHRTWYDFRPGMPLRNIMNVFLPRYTNSSERFIMASQADRMRLSKCYTKGGMTCITCHNPHISVKQTGTAQFNNACVRCHIKDAANKDFTLEMAANSVCKAPKPDIAAKKGDCISCHLPKVGSIDIPHVRITDHYIGKKLKQDESDAVAKFLGLKCLTQEKPSPLTMAKGYIALFDKFIPEPLMLDSANFYLQQCAHIAIEKQFETVVHYHFSKNDMNAIVQYAPQLNLEKINDAWTCYRIGDAFMAANDPQKAEPYLAKAVEKMPYCLEFRNKLGGC